MEQLVYKSLLADQANYQHQAKTLPSELTKRTHEQHNNVNRNQREFYIGAITYKIVAELQKNKFIRDMFPLELLYH